MAWTTTWPTETGHYFFYGHTSKFDLKNNNINFGLVKVQNLSGNPIYIIDGEIIYPNSGGVAYFKKVGDIGITDEMTLFLQNEKKLIQERTN